MASQGNANKGVMRGRFCAKLDSHFERVLESLYHCSLRSNSDLFFPSPAMLLHRSLGSACGPPSVIAGAGCTAALCSSRSVDRLNPLVQIVSKHTTTSPHTAASSRISNAYVSELCLSIPNLVVLYDVPSYALTPHADSTTPSLISALRETVDRNFQASTLSVTAPRNTTLLTCATTVPAHCLSSCLISCFNHVNAQVLFDFWSMVED